MSLKFEKTIYFLESDSVGVCKNVFMIIVLGVYYIDESFAINVTVLGYTK